MPWEIMVNAEESDPKGINYLTMLEYDSYGTITFRILSLKSP